MFRHLLRSVKLLEDREAQSLPVVSIACLMILPWVPSAFAEVEDRLLSHQKPGTMLHRVTATPTTSQDICGINRCWPDARACSCMLILLVGTEILLSESERAPIARCKRIRHDKRRTLAISPRRFMTGRQLRTRILDTPSFLADSQSRYRVC